MRGLGHSFLIGLYHLANIFFGFFLFLTVMRWLLAWGGGDYIFGLIVFLTDPGINVLSLLLPLKQLNYFYVYFSLLCLVFLLLGRFLLLRFLIGRRNRWEEKTAD